MAFFIYPASGLSFCFLYDPPTSSHGGQKPGVAGATHRIENVLKTKLKLDSPLSESDRKGSQLQFCWMCILQFSLPGGRRRTHPKANSTTNSILADSARIGFRLNLTLGTKTTCTDDAASRWQVAVSCLSQLTATQLVETCIACRMHAHLHSEI